MVERRVCTFCGVEIEPGTGRMYVKKDGVTYQFCSSKCFKNLVELRRVPRRTTWTRYYEREKLVRQKAVPAETPAKKRKVKKVKAAKDAPEKPEAEEAPSEEEKQEEPDEAEEAPAPKRSKAGKASKEA